MITLQQENVNKYLKIGERLKELRLKKGESQRDAANNLKMPVSTYSNYENGNRVPKADTLKKIARYFDVSMDWLLSGGTLEAARLSFERDPNIELVSLGHALSQELNLPLEATGKVVKTIADTLRPLYTRSREEVEIRKSLWQLNDLGKRTAVERVQELTHIEKYLQSEADLEAVAMLESNMTAKAYFDTPENEVEPNGDNEKTDS